MRSILPLLSFLVGLLLVTMALRSAVRTFVLPRSAADPLARLLFLVMRRIFDLWTIRANTYLERDRAMALYAPVSLLMLLPVWLVVVLLGFMGMFWSVGVRPWRSAFILSGSSLLTLGYAPVQDLPATILSLTEATIGLLLVALLIAYLPAIYTAFSRREAAVAMLEVRAGSPPSALVLIERSHRIGRLHRLGELWITWELWFADIEESHTSLAALPFFRSPHPDRSWITAAGAVLDAAALVASTVDIQYDTQADLCIRAGYVALRSIADFFSISHNPDPHYPEDPISITRDEFNDACDELARQGVP
ncbi:MAG: hypothetical protein ACRDIB_15125, partial [Ardenticatenaceae bacterium]